MSLMLHRRGLLKPHGLATLTHVLSATANNGADVTLPEGIQAGDLIVLWDWAWSDSGVPATAVPSGFTSAINANDESLARGILSYKIAAGTEGGNTATGMEASGGKVNVEGKVVSVFRGDRPIESVSVKDTASELTSSDPADQTVNASGGTAPLIVLAGYAATAAVDPRSFSPAKDGEVNASGSGIDMWLARKIYNSSPADVTVGMADEGSNALVSAFLECS